jgi:signal recognition particle receptor subunit beta
MESHGVPFIVGVNKFHGQLDHRLEDVREAIAVPEDVPLITTDARDRTQTKAALLELVQHALLRASVSQQA